MLEAAGGDLAVRLVLLYEHCATAFSTSGDAGGTASGERIKDQVAGIGEEGDELPNKG